MPWPKNTVKPEYDCSQAKLIMYLRAQCETNNRLRSQIARLKDGRKVNRWRNKKYRGRERELKRVVQTQFAPDKIRFLGGDMKYYYGAFTYTSLRTFLKTYNITPRRFEAIVLCQYYSHMLMKDFKEFGFTAQIIEKCERSDFLKKIDVKGSKLKMYVPTDFSNDLLEEYRNIVDELKCF